MTRTEQGYNYRWAGRLKGRMHSNKNPQREYLPRDRKETCKVELDETALRCRIMRVGDLTFWLGLSGSTPLQHNAIVEVIG